VSGAGPRARNIDMRAIPSAVLQAARRLFWDVDVAALDPELHEDFILGRVLSEGDWTIVHALREEVGDQALRAFVDRAPHRLDKRTRRFLDVVLPANSDPCTTPHFRRNSDGLFSR
jgi:hypothetical protein